MEIIYEDSDIVAVNKPAGMLSVPGRVSADNALDRLTHSHPNSRVVHRLDMETSGLLLIPQSYPAQRQLSQQFAARQVKKTYTAIVHGKVAASSGEIVCPLGPITAQRPYHRVDWLSGKSAHTVFYLRHYRAASNSSRVKLLPLTGRTHQLRLHMAYLGNPIIGDSLYSASATREDVHRLFLHAEKLEFIHPRTNRLICLQCDADF